MRELRDYCRLLQIARASTQATNGRFVASNRSHIDYHSHSLTRAFLELSRRKLGHQFVACVEGLTVIYTTDFTCYKALATNRTFIACLEGAVNQNRVKIFIRKNKILLRLLCVRIDWTYKTLGVRV